MAYEYKNSIIVIVPMHNEELIAEKCISAVLRVLNRISLKTKLVIVNDGSEDNTEKIILSIKRNNKEKIIYLKNGRNKGYGASLYKGVSWGIKNEFKYAIFMDSDLTNRPEDINKFAFLTRYDNDLVKASRYTEGGSMERVPKTKVLISRIGNFIASLLFNTNIKDCTNGFRMIKLSAVRSFRPKEKDFSVIMEELYFLRKRNASFAEMPVKLTIRSKGKSHFKYTPRVFWKYFKYPLRYAVRI